jgi:hypothetical protein
MADIFSEIITLFYLFRFFYSIQFVKLAVVLGTIILISILVIFCNKIISGNNIGGVPRRKNSNLFIFEVEHEQKLILLTKFNTLVNKIMPESVNDFVQGTYEKIYGKESVKLITNGQKNTKYKKIKRKTTVSFKDHVEEMEFII